MPKNRIILFGSIALTSLFLGILVRQSMVENQDSHSGHEKPLSSRGQTSKRTQFLRENWLDSQKGKLVQKALNQEKILATMDPAEFPTLIENILREGSDSLTVFRIAELWMERDLDGYLAWIKKSSGNFLMREQGIHLGLSGTLITKIAKEDPRLAWEIAAEIPGVNRERKQMDILFKLLDQDPSLALELVRENLRELSMRHSWMWDADPIKLIPVVNELLPGPSRDEIISGNVGEYLNKTAKGKKLKQAKRWFDQLSPEIQQHALRNLERYAISNPEGEKYEKLRKLWLNGQ